MIGDPAIIRPQVELIHWKFSCIDGDILMGDGVKCYATRHFHAKYGQEVITQRLHEAADILRTRLGGRLGFEAVVRRKVELVLFDDRSIKTQCTGGCPECHLDDLREGGRVVA